MASIVWKVETRNRTGKENAHKMRAAGKVPAVAYGRGLQTTTLAIDAMLAVDLIKAGNWNQALIELDVPGAPQFKDKIFMIREMQRHHLKGHPLAIDLVAIRLDQKIKVQVPLDISGGNEVKKTGGILDILHRTLEVKCLPTAIPSSIPVSAAHLGLGHTLHLSEIVLPAGIETDMPMDLPICTVVIPRIVEEAKPVEAAEGEAAEAAEGATEEEKGAAEKKDKAAPEKKEKGAAGKKEESSEK